IGKFHNIGVIHGAVFIADIGKFTAAAVAAARITENNIKAGISPHFHFVVEYTAKNGARAAVYMQNTGEGLIGVSFFSFFVAGRFHSPAVNFYAIGAGIAMELGRNYFAFLLKPIVKMRNLLAV